MQTFIAPISTSYKIECWGASGGNSYEDDRHSGYYNTVYGGKGGYCSGKVIFPSNLSVYIYVGQTGEGTIEKTFNGGGTAGSDYDSKSGGGATDVRLVEGWWNNFLSLKSRIIVAAGGGGAEHYLEGSNGGNAGGMSGGNGFFSMGEQLYPYSIATGATQTLGGIGAKGGINGYDGTFGCGGNYCGVQFSDGYFGSGGGSGYYGGGAGSVNHYVVGTGAGGSSFISGYVGCDAISSESTEGNIIHTGQPNHYSGYVFTNSVMIDGGSVMPSPSGGTEIGHEGNGYCIITWQQLPQ